MRGHWKLKSVRSDFHIYLMDAYAQLRDELRIQNVASVTKPDSIQPQKMFPQPSYETLGICPS